MIICVDRVRKKIDKVLNLIFESNSSNKFIKSDVIDINDKTPRAFRGITRVETIKQCIENNIDFYYIDTGYMGCYPKKIWHRFVKNNFQNLSHLSYEDLSNLLDIKLLENRFFEIMKIKYNEYKPIKQIKGSNILLIPPTKKVLACLSVMKHIDFTVDDFINYVTEEIKKYTNRNVIVRYKPNRDIRIKAGTRLIDQLTNDDIHCVVTFNSIAAFESIQNGYATITLGPNAANYLSEKEFKNIDNPYFPNDDKIREHSLYLTACQFNRDEFKNGYATEMIEKIQSKAKYYNFKYQCQ